MTMRAHALTIAAAAAVTLSLAPAAGAATKRCAEPSPVWERATPQEAGMDAAKLQSAIDYASQNAAFAVRVYRHGCLVGEDRLAPLNRGSQYESWSLAKSVTALLFGRAMTLGLIHPDDPVGSLIPEADAAHGKVTLRHLLTMTSGVRWNGLRDYNVFTMPDRIVDWLALETVKAPGAYYEYAQSAVAIVAEAVERATGRDAEEWLQDELFVHLGITKGSWRWVRDKAGNVLGFAGVNMVPDDFGRLGELMRRDGVWKGRRLLSRAFMREAIAPSPTNGCYGWLIWVNAGKPCVGVRIQNRPIRNARQMPTMPVDMFRFSGLFGQLTTTFPTQGLVLVRNGQDPGLVPAGGQSWELGVYTRVLDAITDEKVERPADADAPGPAITDPDSDSGFQNAILEPDEYAQGAVQSPLPPAGPARARVLRMRLAHRYASRAGRVTVRATCPAVWPGRSGQACTGEAKLAGARRAVSYSIPAGATKLLRFSLARRLRAARSMEVSAVNRDAAGGAPVSATISVRPAKQRKARRR